MTDDRTPDQASDPVSQDPDVMAAELVLGLLEGSELAVANRRVLSEPDFAARVERWQAHFGALYDPLPSTPPPANLLARVLAGIDPPANDNGGTLRRWQGATALFGTAAAALLLMLVTQPSPPPQEVATVAPAAPRDLLVTQITADGAELPIAAVFDPATGALRVAPATLVDKDHRAELWVIPSDGIPRSLGLLPPGTATIVNVKQADRARFAAGSVLAVSVEPPGGAPAGKPTGPVVAKGALSVV